MVAARPKSLDATGRDGLLMRRRVYRHKTDFLISGLAWSNKPGEPFQLALCSLIKGKKNCVQIVRLSKDDHDQEIRSVSAFAHQLPPTKLLWMPRPQNYGLAPCHNQFSDSTNSLLATSSDQLRLWRVQHKGHTVSNAPSGSMRGYKSVEQNSPEVDVKLECLLSPSPNTEGLLEDLDSIRKRPLTSFDWNEIDPRLIVATSLDQTCTLWNVEYEKPVVTYKSGSVKKVEHLAMGKVSKRLVAHEAPAYGVSFSRYGSGRDVFVSVGGDRSLRSFDARILNTVILYEWEDVKGRALVRVDCSKQSENLISFFAIESNEVQILDIRKPGELVCSLTKHTNDVNCMSWAPHSATHLTTASDDKQALIWNLDTQTGSLEEPLLGYKAEGRINAMSWSSAHPDWIAIAYSNYLELLRV